MDTVTQSCSSNSYRWTYWTYLIGMTGKIKNNKAIHAIAMFLLLLTDPAADKLDLFYKFDRDVTNISKLK